jgi:hypothetical protein
MSTPLIQIGDEVREMTAAELTEWQRHVTEIEARAAADSAKDAARNSALDKLAALGLTEAEVKALVG